MEFREYAAKETAASAADLVERLAKAAESERDRAVKQVSDEAKKAADAQQKAADALQKAADALQTELQAAVKQKMALTASLKEAQAQAESLRGELKIASERGEVASRQLAEARKANEKLEAARDELTATVARTIENAVSDKASLEEAVSIAHSQSEAADAKLGAVTDLFKQSAARVKVLERAQEEHERVVRELEARLQAAPAHGAAAAAQPPLALLDDLLSSFQALASATTISDILTTLVEQLAAQYPRVALFRVKKNHLQGEHQIGFDLKTDIAKVMMPLGMDSLLARAASTGLIERLTAEELKDSSRAPFSGNPRSALAIPVIAAGETLAIVYADDVGAPKQKRSADADVAQARLAEAMQQHAIALIMRMTNELKVRSELQAYAQSLLRELEQMYAADQQAGKAGDDLRGRLKGNLEYARSIFESRVTLEGGDAATLLEDELTATIEGESSTPFGRDLALAAGRSPVGVNARNAAEAS